MKKNDKTTLVLRYMKFYFMQIGFVAQVEIDRMSLLMILFLTLLTIHMNVISRSPESVGTTHIMNWMIACIIFVFFAIIEYGAMLFCRFVFKYKSFERDYAEKQLMQVDFISLIISMLSFLIFIIVFSTSTT